MVTTTIRKATEEERRELLSLLEEDPDGFAADAKGWFPICPDDSDSFAEMVADYARNRRSTVVLFAWDNDGGWWGHETTVEDLGSNAKEGGAHGDQGRPA